jgi:hypothetical protein
MRILLTYVLPFLAPFLAYALWAIWAGRVERQRGSRPDAPPIWVTGLAVMVLGAALFLIGHAVGPRPDPGVYVPPRVEDGTDRAGPLRAGWP